MPPAAVVSALGHTTWPPHPDGNVVFTATTRTPSLCVGLAARIAAPSRCIPRSRADWRIWPTWLPPTRFRRGDPSASTRVPMEAVARTRPRCGPASGAPGQGHPGRIAPGRRTCTSDARRSVAVSRRGAVPIRRPLAARRRHVRNCARTVNRLSSLCRSEDGAVAGPYAWPYRVAPRGVHAHRVPSLHRHPFAGTP